MFRYIRNFLSILGLVFCCVIKTSTMQLELEKTDYNVQDQALLSDELLAKLNFKKININLEANASKTFAILLDRSLGSCIIDYFLGGKCVAKLIQTEEVLYFESRCPQRYNFVFSAPIENNEIKIITNGDITFEKEVITNSALLIGNTISFKGPFLSKENLAIYGNCINNPTQINCNELYCEAGVFNCTSGSKLIINQNAYLKILKKLFNSGQVTCGNTLFLDTSAFENYGLFSVNSLGLKVGKLTNFKSGTFNINNVLEGSCEELSNQGTIRVQGDCLFPRLGKLVTHQSSQLHVGGSCKGNVDTLCLEGTANIGKAAIFAVNSHVTLNGPLRAPIIHIESKDVIFCNSLARLTSNHHIGLQARGWIQYEGDAFEPITSISQSLLESSDSLFSKFIPGIYLCSAQSGIKKAGTIVSKKSTVMINAKKELVHTGLTEAGCASGAMLLLYGDSIIIDKDSLLKGFDAQIIAKELLEQNGLTQIERQLLMKAAELIHRGESDAKAVALQADRAIVAAESSKLTGDYISFHAEQKIEDAGKTTGKEQLSYQANDVALTETSQTKAKDMHIKAATSIATKGQCDVSGTLVEEAKYIDHFGKTKAKDIKIKAHRLWWGHCGSSLEAENTITRDALVSLDILNLNKAKNITINSAFDFNFLGFRLAQYNNTNALLSLNAGFCIPLFNLSDSISFDNAFKIGERLVSRFGPSAIGFACTMASMLYNKKLQALYEHGTALCHQVKQLDGQSAGLADVIGILSSAKSLTRSTIGLSNTMIQGVPLLFSANSYKPIDMPNVGEVCLKLFTDSVDALGPQMARDALIDINSGALFGIDGDSYSLLNVNLGASLFANRSNINTRYGVNYGLLAAICQNIQANQYKNCKNIYGIHQVNFNTKELELGENSYIDSCKQVDIDTESLKGAIGNTIASKSTHVKTQKIDNKGDVSGTLILDFQGMPQQLISIGNVRQLYYKGTTEDGIADKLADGQNGLIRIMPNGQVVVDTQEKVYLSDQHKMGHGLSIKTEGEVQVDQSLGSKQSIHLEGQKGIQHNCLDADENIYLKGQSVKASSQVVRKTDSNSYEDKVDPVIVRTGKGFGINAEEDIDYTGVKVKSGAEGTHIKAGGKLLLKANELEKHKEETALGKDGIEQRIKKTDKTYNVCEFASAGRNYLYTDGVAELQAAKFAAQGGTTIYGKKGVKGQKVEEKHELEKETITPGNWWHGPKTQKEPEAETKEHAVEFNETVTPVISSEGHIELPFSTNSQEIILLGKTVSVPLCRKMLLATNLESRPSRWWKKHKDGYNSVDVNYAKYFRDSYSGKIITNAEKVDIEVVIGGQRVQVCGENPNTKINLHQFEAYYRKDPISARKLTSGASMVIGMAVTMATSGIGTAFGAAISTGCGIQAALAKAVISKMSSAALSSMATLAVQALVVHGGNPTKAALALANTKTLKKMIFSVGTAAALGLVGQGLNACGLPETKTAKNAFERLLYTAPRKIADAGIYTASQTFEGKEFEKALLHNIRIAAAETIGCVLSHQIGDAYNRGTLNPVSHKLAHAALGAFEGAIIAGQEGVIAGSMGAFIAESFADIITPSRKGFELVKEIESKFSRLPAHAEYLNCIREELVNYINRANITAEASKIIAASTALFLGHDIEVASLTAGNAIDNNYLILIGYGLWALTLAKAAYNVYYAYEMDGPTAAFKQLGIEVIVWGTGKIGTKLAFKAAGMFYPTAKAAVESVFNANPNLNLFLNKAIDNIVFAGEKLGVNALQPFMKQVSSGVECLETHLMVAEQSLCIPEIFKSSALPSRRFDFYSIYMMGLKKEVGGKVKETAKPRIANVLKRNSSERKAVEWGDFLGDTP